MVINNIINNESQVVKFGRRNNELCFINILTDGNDLSEQRISNKNLIDIRNLLGLQFKTNDSYYNFKLNEALNFIKFEKNIINKVIIVPYGTNQNEFIQLENEFIKLFGDKETYTLVLLSQDSEDILYDLLENNKFNKKITSVEFIKHYSTKIVRALGRLIIMFNKYYSIGVINLRRYQGQQYLGFPSIIYYWGCGAKYISFRDFSLDNARGDSGRKNFYKFNQTTLQADKLTLTEVNNLKIIYKSKFYEVLRDSNLDNIYSKIETNINLNFAQIQNLIQQSSGKKIY